MIVIDASALASYSLREEGSEPIRILLERGAVSIDLVVKESCNAVLLAHRRGLINAEQSRRVLKVLLMLADTNVKMYPQRDLIEDAFRIASENNVTIYDTLYLALAKKLGATLLSKDAKQIEVAKRVGVKTVPF